MAGRYSKEYRPNEFVKLPFEEVAKVMAMKEQQYQQGYLQPAAYQQEMGKVEVRTPDIEYHQQLIKQATDKARQLAEETYGGDYGAAASDITRTLANEASNPFYSWTKSKMDEYKKAKAIDMELTAKGQKLGFNTDLLNKSYFDKENNKYNTELGFDVEQKLDWTKEMNDVAARNIVQFQNSYEEGLKKALARGEKTGYYEQLTSGKHGTKLSKGEIGRKVAFEDFKNTDSYAQMKKTLTQIGWDGKTPMNESSADEYIYETFNGILNNKLNEETSVSRQNVKDQAISTGNGSSVLNPNLPKPQLQIQASSSDKIEALDDRYNNLKEGFKKLYSSNPEIKDIDNYISKLNKWKQTIGSKYPSISRGALGKATWNAIISAAKAGGIPGQIISEFLEIKDENPIEKINKKINELELKKNNLIDINYSNIPLNKAANSAIGKEMIGSNDNAKKLYNSLVTSGKGNIPVSEFVDHLHNIEKTLEQSPEVFSNYYSGDYDAYMNNLVGQIKGNPKIKLTTLNDDGTIKSTKEVPLSILTNRVASGKIDDDDKTKYKINWSANRKLGSVNGAIDNKHQYEIPKEILINQAPALYGMAEASRIRNSYDNANPAVNLGDDVIKDAPVYVNGQSYIPVVSPIGSKSDSEVLLINNSSQIPITFEQLMEMYDQQMLSKAIEVKGLNVNMNKTDKQ